MRSPVGGMRSPVGGMRCAALPAAWLYTSVKQPVSSLAENPRPELIRHYSENIPDISLHEISIALGQLKNNKAPGEDGNISELLKAVRTPILEVLQRLFNVVLLEGVTPEAWNRSIVVLLFKKDDNTALKNYRSISLLSHVYMVFSRVITNRLMGKFDDCQPPEQAMDMDGRLEECRRKPSIGRQFYGKQAKESEYSGVNINSDVSSYFDELGQESNTDHV
ncbi:unnamed protein product [Euphydryas editha]|uniref:Reverse transcriptase n=1 Tax=Euphydryas editha TaxID=104508 RepID=A0AAU9VE68_EUPED|nr:unnamed protein product [Euphydryas editha]